MSGGFLNTLLGIKEQAANVVNDQLNSRCVPESIYNAKVWELMTGQPTRIIRQKIDEKNNVDHLQAEGFDGKQWIPLTQHNFDTVNNRMKVEPWKRHYAVEPYEITDADSIIKEQKGNVSSDLLEYLKGLKK